jgi:hypothetical protein
MPTSLETHTRLAKAQFRKAVQRIIPVNGSDPGLTVEILTGVHAGSSTGVSGPTFSIGPETGNDIMLLDDEVLDGAANFRTEGSVFGTLLTVRTHRDDLKINGAAVRSGVASAPEPLPCEIDFNGIRLRFRPVAGTERPLMQKAAQAVLPMLMTVAFVAFGMQIYLASVPTSPLLLQATPAADPAVQKARVASAEAVVRTMITEAGFSDRLTVAKLGGGTLSINGTLPPDMMPDWHEVRSAIDKAAGDAVIISDVAETPSLTDMPPIAAVRLGADPVVILANGDEIGPGEKISGDWVIRTISEDSLEVEQNGDSLVVTF